jgi:hypothetical protein
MFRDMFGNSADRLGGYAWVIWYDGERNESSLGDRTSRRVWPRAGKHPRGI